MVQCPECGKNVEADFGMANCAACGAVFMVEIDGSINTSSESAFAANQDPLIEEQKPLLEEDQPDSLSQENLASPEDFLPDQEASSDEATGQENDNVDESFEASVEVESEDFPEYAQPLSADNNDPLDLQKFDQSAASELSDGEFLYDVSIRGLDSADLKKEVLAALADKRFSFSQNELRKSIRDGELPLRDLNPVRAMLVVLKMQEFDVEVEWGQKHFSRVGEKTMEAEE
jgi:hypothetical protein